MPEVLRGIKEFVRGVATRRAAGNTEPFQFTYLCVRHASKAPKGSGGGHGFSSSLEE